MFRLAKCQIEVFVKSAPKRNSANTKRNSNDKRTSSDKRGTGEKRGSTEKRGTGEKRGSTEKRGTGEKRDSNDRKPSRFSDSRGKGRSSNTSQRPNHFSRDNKEEIVEKREESTLPFGLPEMEEDTLLFDAKPQFIPKRSTSVSYVEDNSKATSIFNIESLEPIPGFKPEILAPAGDTSSFLAALAAGADAVYVGLKHFSARAGADNFSMTELSRMVNLANEHGKKVNIAFNSLVKPNDIAASGRLMKRLARDAKPNAIIIQDPGLIDIARQAGFAGEIHLSTLANITHPKALEIAYSLGADRVILPREINIDEVRQVAKTCPEELSLELFVHGALCYCVSGRCYWSSYMGGKSGLRGRCVQPCRRVYKQKSREGRYFSSQDLSLDVLVKSLLSIPKVNCWKIEGRKKGPHYVYHAVMAYQLLRDEGNSARKEAEGLLNMALGRPSTHGLFLPQNPQKVTAPEENTGSGLLVGKIQFDVVEEKSTTNKGKPEGKRNKTETRQNTSAPYFKPRIALVQKDLLRIGYEDDAWYSTLPVTRSTPKAGSYTLRLPRHKTPKAGTPVFLIDRREPDLIKELASWEKMLAKAPASKSTEVNFVPHLPKPCGAKRGFNIRVRSNLPQGKETRAARGSLTGLWMSPSTVRAISRTLAPRISWWLPPVIWPNEEHIWQRAINEAVRNGATHFVCNEPWQIGFFQDLPAFQAHYSQMEANASMELPEESVEKKGKPNSPSHKMRVPKGGKSNADRNSAFHLIAGPFCNIANASTIALMKNMGFNAAIVSPELSRDDFLLLPRQSCLPLGFVIEGFWPMGISRHEPLYIKNNLPFTSPKGEQFWSRKYGQNLWIYPSWPMDLTKHRTELEHAGYSFFASLEEHCPEEQERAASEFNWNIPLL